MILLSEHRSSRGSNPNVHRILSPVRLPVSPPWPKLKNPVSVPLSNALKRNGTFLRLLIRVQFLSRFDASLYTVRDTRLISAVLRETDSTHLEEYGSMFLCRPEPMG